MKRKSLIFIKKIIIIIKKNINEVFVTVWENPQKEFISLFHVAFDYPEHQNTVIGVIPLFISLSQSFTIAWIPSMRLKHLASQELMA